MRSDETRCIVGKLDCVHIGLFCFDGGGGRCLELSDKCEGGIDGGFEDFEIAVAFAAWFGHI